MCFSCVSAVKGRVKVGLKVGIDFYLKQRVTWLAYGEVEVCRLLNRPLTLKVGWVFGLIFINSC